MKSIYAFAILFLFLSPASGLSAQLSCKSIIGKSKSLNELWPMASTLSKKKFPKVHDVRDIQTYYRGIRIRNFDDLDLNFNVKRGLVDHVSSDWTVALNHAFYSGKGSIRLILEYNLPKKNVMPDGHRPSPRTGEIAFFKNKHIEGIAHFIKRVGVIPNRLPTLKKFNETDKTAYDLWSEYKGIELVESIVRDSGPNSNLILWMSKERLIDLVLESIEQKGL